jgi:hypothetical protein
MPLLIVVISLCWLVGLGVVVVLCLMAARSDRQLQSRNLNQTPPLSPEFEPRLKDLRPIRATVGPARRQMSL